MAHGPGSLWAKWEVDPGKQSTSVISGQEEASPEPVGAQVSVEESQEELTSGLDVGECEKRAREMLRVRRDADVPTVPSCRGASSRPSPSLGPITFPQLADDGGLSNSCCRVAFTCLCSEDLEVLLVTRIPSNLLFTKLVPLVP